MTENEIRLLVLQPGQDDEDIRCTLINTSLDNLPPFDAISYTWADSKGTQDRSFRVHCGPLQLPVPVTANCETMLRRMRLPSLKRLVWVDAICIDQASVQARNHQVHEMAKIYKGASIVPVYLGEADQMDNDLFDFLQGTCGLKLLHSTETYAKYLKRLVSRSWFDRTWVMQEFGLERRGFFIYGRQLRWIKCPSKILSSSIYQSKSTILLSLGFGPHRVSGSAVVNSETSCNAPEFVNRRTPGIRFVPCMALRTI